jgi:hypothetical protein
MTNELLDTTEERQKGEAIVVERYSSFIASPSRTYRHHPCVYLGVSDIFH